MVTSSSRSTLVSSPPIDGGGGSSGKAPLSERDQRRFDKARNKLLDKLRNISAKCVDFLKKANLSVTDIIAAVQAQQPFNGKKSSISRSAAGVIDINDPYYDGYRTMHPGSEAVGRGLPVSHAFRRGTVNAETGIAPGGRVGATLADRSSVYFRPGGLFSSGGLQPRTILHESLHSLTGLGDTLLAQKLNLPEGSGSADISRALIQNGCL